MTNGLLLLHAWPLDARMWEPQLGLVPDGVPAIAPNHPGFGGTEPAGEVMTMALAADHAMQALDDAGADRAVVCGLSMGGYIAFEIWRRSPERVAGLILANTRAVADAEEAAAARRALADRLRSEGNVLAEEPPALLAEGAPSELQARVRGWIADQPAASIGAAALGMAERPDSTPDLPSIDVPTLVITSTEDRLIPAEVSAEMAGMITGARLESIEGVGHLSNVEAHEAFNAALLEHLAVCGIG